jgi:hypothetical protein
LDHGVPDNVNSAYAESAHIPLSKVTARNTQKRVVSFTKQAAIRYTENLAISSAWRDMENDAVGALQNNVPACATLSGRGFAISWRAGDCSPMFIWNRTYPSDNPTGDTLSHKAMFFLGHHCLPHMPDGKLPCFTEFVCDNGHKYRAHPSIYDGRPWHDHAMVTWHGYAHPLPALIHTFVDLRNLPPRTRITLRESGQRTITEAGVYALIHSFDAIDEEVRDVSNSMIGHYKLHRDGLHSTPTLYLVGVHNLVAPTIGIRDVGQPVDTSVEDEQYLFLFRRKEEWALCWDSMINKCHSDRESESLEGNYELEAEEEAEDDVEDDIEDDDEEDSNINCDNNSNANEAVDSGDEVVDSEDEAVDGNDEVVASDTNNVVDDADNKELLPTPTKKKRRR